VKTTRRKRQLIFFDSQTQIDQEVLQQQIGNPLTETRPAPYPPAPCHRRLSAEELLNSPCTCESHTCTRGVLTEEVSTTPEEQPSSCVAF